MGRDRGRDHYDYRISPDGVEVEIVVNTHSQAPIPDSSHSESSFEVVYDDKGTTVTTYLEELPLLEGRVRFSDCDEYFTIQSREDLSPIEREAVWFRKSDLKRMRKEHERKAMNGITDSHSSKDPPQNDELQEALHQLMAVSVVLEEQRRQREENVHDPELLSDKYQTFIRRSRYSMFISNLVREEGKKHGLRCHLPLSRISDGPLMSTKFEIPQG